MSATRNFSANERCRYLWSPYDVVKQAARPTPRQLCCGDGTSGLFYFSERGADFGGVGGEVHFVARAVGAREYPDMGVGYRHLWSPYDVVNRLAIAKLLYTLRE